MMIHNAHLLYCQQNGDKVKSLAASRASAKQLRRSCRCHVLRYLYMIPPTEKKNSDQPNHVRCVQKTKFAEKRAIFVLSVNINHLYTVTSRLSAQLDLEVALRSYARGAYLTVLCPTARTVCVQKRKTLRASIDRFSELEDILYVWIDSMRRAKLPVPPSLVIVKAKRIAQQLSILEGDFKASWQWLSRFRKRRGLQKILLHGEGAEVDKEDPKLLAALDDLYATISRYDPENVYNMDETGLFIRRPQYN